MALRRTKLSNNISVTGISTVGIFTVGVTQTAGGVGIASTTYLRSVILHNTGFATCSVGMYINPNTTSVQTGFGITANRILKVDLSSNETYFLDLVYPIVLTGNDAISIDVNQPLYRNVPGDNGSGIGSVVNVRLIGDTDI